MRTPTRKHREKNPTAPKAGDQALEAKAAEELEAFEAESIPEIEEPRLETLPMVAIVGRPNVGKSTLFNRIIGRRKAVVHDQPGVTRDRNVERAEWDDLPFLCVDTGGFDVELDDPLLSSVVEQVRMAIEDADVIIFLAAVHETAHPADEEIVRMLRGIKKPVFMAINKCDSPAIGYEANDFYRFGYEMIYPVTALHGVGIADLLADVLQALRDLKTPPSHIHGEGGISLALVGRQNVGKSTMVNRLCGRQRVIAAPLPGTTRDSVDTIVTAPNGKKFNLIDTAGIRRRGKVEVGIEKLSVLSSMVSMRRADVAALLIDGKQGITEQDAHIAGYCLDEGLPIIILVNKWDIVDKDHRTADLFTKHLEEEWGFLRYAPILYVSAKEGQRTHRIFELVERVYNNAQRRVPTHELNKRLEEWVGRKPPTMKFNRRPKVRFMTQTRVHPPTFTLFVNDPELFHFSYLRYINNRLREAFDFEGTIIRIQLRKNGRKREGEVDIDIDKY